MIVFFDISSEATTPNPLFFFVRVSNVYLIVKGRYSSFSMTYLIISFRFSGALLQGRNSRLLMENDEYIVCMYFLPLSTMVF